MMFEEMHTYRHTRTTQITPMMVEELMIQLGVQPPHDVRRIDDSTRGAIHLISAENLKRSGGVGGPPHDVGKTPPAEEELGMQRMRKAKKPPKAA